MVRNEGSSEAGRFLILSTAPLKEGAESGSRFGIITTKPEQAQNVCNTMMEGGIRAIWNFSTAHLDTPESMIVHNENLAVSLAMISHDLEQVIQQEQRKEE